MWSPCGDIRRVQLPEKVDKSGGGGDVVAGVTDGDDIKGVQLQEFISFNTPGGKGGECHTE